MPRMTWDDGVSVKPLTVGLLPAANASCCCTVDMCAASIYQWATERMTMPDQYANDDHAFGYPNWDIGGIGDQSNGGQVYGGPLRTSHFAFHWENVFVSQGHTFTDVRLTLKIAPDQGTVDCDGRIDLRIVGHDVGDSPDPYTVLDAANYWENAKNNAATSNQVNWQQIPKPDPWQCGISEVETPNIAGIMNEIVGRPDWVYGNSLTIIIEGLLHHVTFDEGTYVLQGLIGKLTRTDGGSFLADGFRIGQTIRMATPGEDLFINCVNEVGVDYLKWTTAPAWWPVNGNRTARLDAYVVACSGLVGAQTPATDNWDYHLSIETSPGQHCIRAQ